MDITLNVEQETVKLLQITDTHLFQADGGSLLSVNTAESFAAVVEEICVQRIDFDAVIATGDISQDHSFDSYRRFIDGVAPLIKPCFWLPGNHDQKAMMSSLLPSAQVQEPECILAGKHWQIIILDSQQPNVPHGRLSHSQLKLLQHKLAEGHDRHTLILLHHHPLLVGSQWLDQHALKDSSDFWNVVQQHPNVKAVICGHVHQCMEKEFAGVKVMATPSTCIQFKPNSNEFALDPLSPGWREIQLHADGEISTQVKRLANGKFLPDFTANGY